MDRALEGWFTDPYARHEARWLSLGQPTKVVRDGDVESYDDPPEGPAVRELTPIEPTHHADASSLERADDEEREGPYDPKRANQRAADVIDQTPQLNF
jgi:hypothetical protein